MALMRKPVSARRSIKKRASRYKAKAPWSRVSRTTTGTNRPGAIVGLSRSDMGFPDRVQTKLLYSDWFELNMTSGAAAVQTFRLNSLFDPDYTGVGHQPMWHDQLSAVYRNYRVKGSKITAEFMPVTLDNPGTATYGPYVVAIITSNQTTLTASSTALITEDPNSVSKVIGPKLSGRPYAQLSNTFSPQRDLGLDPYEKDLSSGVTSNPDQVFYAHVVSRDMATTLTSRISVRVKIEFQAEYFNRIEGVLS